MVDGERNTAALTFTSDGICCRGSQIVVPDAEDCLHQKCLSVHHNTLFAGHLGRDRTVQECYKPIGGLVLCAGVCVNL